MSLCGGKKNNLITGNKTKLSCLPFEKHTEEIITDVYWVS